MRRPSVIDPDKGAAVAALLIRIVVGPIMAYHGYRKYDGSIYHFVETVKELGLPFPILVAHAVAVIELVGGICLLLGLSTRLWAGLLALQMAGIVFVVKPEAGLIGAPGKGTGFELELLIEVCALALVLLGPGLLALDHRFGLEREAGSRPETRVGT